MNIPDNKKSESQKNKRDTKRDDSSDIAGTPENVRIFTENKATVNKINERKIPNRIIGRFICSAGIIFETKVILIYIAGITTHHISHSTENYIATIKSCSNNC